MASATLELLSRGFGSEVELPLDPASERILDAALALAGASGVENLTMDEIARRAGVGRMTVYRRFGDKDRLLSALAAREGRRCIAELDAASDPGAPIADQVAAAFVASLRIAREHPLLNRLALHEPEAVLAALTNGDAALFTLARDYVGARLRESQRAGVLGDVAVDEAAELLVRLAFSFVLIQESSLPLSDPDRAGDIARRMLAPLLA